MDARCIGPRVHSHVWRSKRFLVPLDRRWASKTRLAYPPTMKQRRW